MGQRITNGLYLFSENAVPYLSHTPAHRGVPYPSKRGMGQLFTLFSRVWDRYGTAFFSPGQSVEHSFSAPTLYAPVHNFFDPMLYYFLTPKIHLSNDDGLASFEHRKSRMN